MPKLKSLTNFDKVAQVSEKTVKERWKLKTRTAMYRIITLYIDQNSARLYVSKPDLFSNFLLVLALTVDPILRRCRRYTLHAEINLTSLPCIISLPAIKYDRLRKAGNIFTYEYVVTNLTITDFQSHYRTETDLKYKKRLHIKTAYDNFTCLQLINNLSLFTRMRKDCILILHFAHISSKE